MRSYLAGALLLLASCSRSEPPKTESSAAEPTASAPAPGQPTEPTPAASAPQVPIVLDRGDGLTVEIERTGTGAEVASSSTVTLHYRAFIDGATEPFDSSYDAGVPLELALGTDAKPRPIAGLARGLVGLRAGTKAKLKIPPALAWGSAGNESAGVPKDAALVYEVDVLGVRGSS